MTWLVDANILSEPTKPAPNETAVEWLRRHEHELVVSPIILGEIRYGIHLVEPGRRRRRLEDWFEQGVARMACLPFDTATGLRWAKLLADLRQAGKAMPIKDSLIAATALVHGLVVATRNVNDFKRTGAKVIDPFAGS